MSCCPRALARRPRRRPAADALHPAGDEQHEAWAALAPGDHGGASISSWSHAVYSRADDAAWESLTLAVPEDASGETTVVARF